MNAQADDLQTFPAAVADYTCYLNGRYSRLADARVSVLDRGFIFGDGVYEVVPVYGRRLFRFDQHIARLERSLAKTRIANPHDPSEWLERMRHLVVALYEATGVQDQLVYLQVTRGVAVRDHVMPTDIAPTVFMKELRRICDKYGILLVADEVQSGAGRTGKWWAIEHTGVQPDIICSAKGIASGMPLGIMMSRADIMDWVPGSHASTFGGNPVCIAAALATLDVIEKEGLLANSTEVGNHMLKRMADWPRQHKLVGDVRGRGLMVGVEIVKDKKTKEYAADERDRIIELAFERGVLFLGCGPSTIRIAPPLVVSKDEADVAVDVLEECIALAGK